MASKKRRICGVAAFSATAIASLLGAQAAASADPPDVPPGLVTACDARPGPSPDSSAFLHGWPSKYSGIRCDTSQGGIYDWFKKTD